MLNVVSKMLNVVSKMLNVVSKMLWDRKAVKSYHIKVKIQSN
jgi:hypothetical protein